MIHFDGKVALVTGSYGGIGEAICRGMADLGAKVAVAGHDAMFQAQAAARHMIAQGGGKQAHIGSVRAQLGLRGRGYAPYCAAKGGMAILCKQLAAEWAPHHIDVNVVAPTFVRTDRVMRRELDLRNDFASFDQRLLETVLRARSRPGDRPRISSSAR